MALCALIFTPPALAAYDPLGSGTTKLTLSKAFARTLAANRVELIPKAGARLRGRSYLLPVSGGNLDPLAGKGEVENDGALVFRHGRRTVPLRKILVRTKRQPLIAKVGGGQLKLTTARSTAVGRAGFGSTVTATSLRLTDKLATRLGKKLRLRDAFEANQLLGSLRTRAQPSTVAVLPEGRATFAPAPAFLAKLDSLSISLNPIAPAERAAGPTFTFPIIGGGQLSPQATLGALRCGGALEFLRLGSGQDIWTEPWFDFGGAAVLAEAELQPAPPLAGKLGQLPLLSLAAGSASDDPKVRAITVSGASLALNETSAAQFNSAFADGEAVFSPGEQIGIVSFTAQAQ